MTKAICKSNTKCVCCGEKVEGVGYSGTLPTSKDKLRYLCEKCHDTIVSPEKALNTHVGADNAQKRMYSITLTPDVDDDEIRVFLMDGKSSPWFLVGEGVYMSPSFRNMKWHKKLNALAKRCPSGKLIAKVMDYDGVVLKEVPFSWKTSGEFEQFAVDMLKA